MKGWRLLYPHPSAVRVAPPAYATHIDPVSKCLAWFVVRTETKNIAVGVFDVHFARAPGIVRGRKAHACSLGEELLVQRVDIRHCDPHPASWIALIAYGEKEVTLVSRHGGKRTAIIGPPIDFEAEHADVIVEAGFKILNAQDGSDSVECDSSRFSGFYRRHNPSLA